MKKLIGLNIAFLILFHPVFSQTKAELGVADIGLVVSDLEASEKFYKEIVGMEEVWAFSLDEDWADEAGASNGRPFSVKMLQQKKGPSATGLKLAYFKQMDKKPEMSGVDVHAGVNYLTFNFDMEGFQALVDRIQKAGIPMTGWVKRDSYQLFFVKDPDGVFVEFVGPPEP